VNAGYTDHGYGANNGTSYWGQDTGHNCTNYVAYVETTNGVPRPSFFLGNANEWWSEASGQIPESTTTPVPGSVAWWNAGQGGAGSDGHVAYVEAVSGSPGSYTITISEDSFPSGPFDWATITQGDSRWPGGFIYFDNLSPPVVQTSSVPPTMVGDPYSAQLGATGGVAPYTWSVTGGSLPSGLTLTSGGVVTGVPFSNGSYAFVATVRGANGASSSGSVSIAVNPGGNLLQHASFEGQDATGWSTLPASSSDVVSMAAYHQAAGLPAGSDYLEFNTTQAGGSVYQDVPAALSPGQSYTFSAWVRAHSATAKAKICLTLWGVWGTPQDGQTCTTVTSAWTRISAPYDVTATGNGTLRAQVYLYTTGVNVDLNATQLSS
jgi:surface antigen